MISWCYDGAELLWLTLEEVMVPRRLEDQGDERSDVADSAEGQCRIGRCKQVELEETFAADRHDPMPF
jgi:hypothetical protein